MTTWRAVVHVTLAPSSDVIATIWIGSSEEFLSSTYPQASVPLFCAVATSTDRRPCPGREIDAMGLRSWLVGAATAMHISPMSPRGMTCRGRITRRAYRPIASDAESRWGTAGLLGLAVAFAASILASGCGSPATPASPASRTSTAARPSPTSAALQWSRGPDLPIAVDEIGVAAVGTDIHIVGGYIGGQAHSTTHLVYDTTARTWATGAPLPVRLDHVGLAAVQGKLYAFGGYGTSGAPTNGTFVFNPATNTWAALAAMPDPRAAAVTVTIGNTIHVIGGRDAHGDTGEHLVFDVASGRWTVAAPMPTPRDHTAFAVLDGRIHVVGGRPGSLTTHEVYDPTTDRWSQLASLPAARSSFAGAVIANRMVVFGGENSQETQVFPDAWAYDAGQDRWLPIAKLPVAVQGTQAATVNGQVYLPGGGPVAGGSQQTATLQILETAHG